MLKIEKFALDNFGVHLTKHQLEVIATISTTDINDVLTTKRRMTGISTAHKTAMAYLQDGLTEVENG